MKLQKDFVAIVSVDTNYMTLKQKQEARQLIPYWLEHLDYSKAIGSWKGKVERSFVVTGFKSYDYLVRFAKAFSYFFHQDAVMIQDKAGNIQLVDKHGNVTTLSGKLAPMSSIEATIDGWTKLNGQYWAVK